jgi:hypothetical protein
MWMPLSCRSYNVDVASTPYGVVLMLPTWLMVLL